MPWETKLRSSSRYRSCADTCCRCRHECGGAHRSRET
jgi:hypothetical protein